MTIQPTRIPTEEAIAMARQDRLACVLRGEKNTDLRNMLDEAIALLERSAAEISHRRHSLDDIQPE